MHMAVHMPPPMSLITSISLAANAADGGGVQVLGEMRSVKTFKQWFERPVYVHPDPKIGVPDYYTLVPQELATSFQVRARYKCGTSAVQMRFDERACMCACLPPESGPAECAQCMPGPGHMWRARASSLVWEVMVGLGLLQQRIGGPRPPLSCACMRACMDGCMHGRHACVPCWALTSGLRVSSLHAVGVRDSDVARRDVAQDIAKKIKDMTSVQAFAKAMLQVRCAGLPCPALRTRHCAVA